MELLTCACPQGLVVYELVVKPQVISHLTVKAIFQKWEPSHISAILSLSGISYCFKNNIPIHHLHLQGSACSKPCHTPSTLASDRSPHWLFSQVASLLAFKPQPKLDLLSGPHPSLLLKDPLQGTVSFFISTY